MRLRAHLPAMPFFSTHSSKPPDPWAGYKLAMQRAVTLFPRRTHYVVMQDDVIPCSGFTGKVYERIKERPDDVISLWVGGLRNATTTAYLQAQIKGERWVQVGARRPMDIHHCVALVWPRAKAEAFLLWTETNMLPGDGRDQQSDDAIVGAWSRRTKNYFWATIPCLVEHDDDVESTIGRPRGGRDRRAISLEI